MQVFFIRSNPNEAHDTYLAGGTPPSVSTLLNRRSSSVREGGEGTPGKICVFAVRDSEDSGAEGRVSFSFFVPSSSSSSFDFEMIDGRAGNWEIRSLSQVSPNLDRVGSGRGCVDTMRFSCLYGNRKLR